MSRPIDIHSMSVDGKPPPGGGDNANLRWWTQEPDEAASTITGILTTLARAQAERASALVVGRRLYGNTSLLGVALQNSSDHPLLRDRISFNVVQSVIDTLVARMAKNKPRPFFLTNGGDYRQQRRAKLLNRFVEGIFRENDAWMLGPEAVRDACVWGDGVVHVFARNKRVAFERVRVEELWIDEFEAMDGAPRQMHRARRVDRAVAMEMFAGSRDGKRPSAESKEARDSLEHAQIETSDTGIDPSALSRVSDLVTVRESWHLPSGPDADDGVRIVTVDGHALTRMEPWKHDFFPFVRFRWCPRLAGMWSQGLAEQLTGIQIEINRILWTIRQSMHMAGSYKVLLENGSKVAKEHINNAVGTIINYQGTKPEYILPPTIQPEVFAHFQTLVAKAYEQAGVSQLSAASRKPAGIESGRALRELSDIESDRFQTVGQEYERFFLALARQSLAVIEDIGGDYEVSAPGARDIRTLSWSDVRMDRDSYILQCYPVSSLPRDPAGRLQTVIEYMQAGLMDPQQGRRALDFPDLDAMESLANAREDAIERVLDDIVDNGIYTSPEPFDNLRQARSMALERYALGRARGLEEERLELLRRYIQRVELIEEEAAAKAAPALPPQAVPESPPVSPLLPNVPGIPAGPGAAPTAP